MRREDDLIQKYLSGLHSVKSPILEQISSELKADGKWGINIGAVEGHILQWLIKSHGISRIIEIGTQYGYSTQWMLEALPEDGIIYTIEKNRDHHKKAKTFITDKRVKFICGDAIKELSSIKQYGPFDMVFIDANKKAYPEYSMWAQENIKSGGMLVGDNSFLFGQVYQDEPNEKYGVDMWEAMRTFNRQLFEAKGWTTCIIPTSEGLTVAYKE